AVAGAQLRIAKADVEARVGFAQLGGAAQLGEGAHRPVVLGLERVDPDREVRAAFDVPGVGEDGEDGEDDGGGDKPEREAGQPESSSFAPLPFPAGKAG